jgi:hypothetical protein
LDPVSLLQFSQRRDGGVVTAASGQAIGLSARDPMFSFFSEGVPWIGKGVITATSGQAIGSPARGPLFTFFAEGVS